MLQYRGFPQTKMLGSIVSALLHPKLWKKLQVKGEKKLQVKENLQVKNKFKHSRWHATSRNAKQAKVEKNKMKTNLGEKIWTKTKVA